MHVHVDSPDGEIKVWLEPRVEVAQNHGIPSREVTRYFASWRSGVAKLKNGGGTTTDIEVASISRHGFWLYLDGRELFVSFKEFPWFAEAPVNKIVNVLRPFPDHLHWPDLDVDLSVESIEHPERFPLRFHSFGSSAAK